MSQDEKPWLHQYENHLKLARNVFDTLDPDEAVATARFELKDALRLLEIADETISVSGVEDIKSVDEIIDWSEYGWRLWFAWRPVYVIDRWHWLTYVPRRRFAERPARYEYGRDHRLTPPKQGA